MIYILGAGPGDPDLISVKGKNLLSCADTLVYAGSLVNPKLLDFCPPHTEIYDSASLTLEEIIDILDKANQDPNKVVVRLHTGDPSLYGAIQEQIDELKARGHELEVIPGISSYAAVAARVQQELTLPGVSQTLVISRIEGRTPVPAAQRPQALAALDASYAFFLSVTMIDSLVEQLIEGGLSPDTPALAMYKATWPEERMVSAPLKDLGAKVKSAGFKATTMILLGKVLDTDYERSKLYDPSFSHHFRDASVGNE
ncbi:MAG: precorrin-4 C(11)-methyltransferase [Coriobacteriia bacterium]|nr:precorrin-4 C(11)-methyltransferase [Coriobacteriia bacterium]